MTIRCFEHTRSTHCLPDHQLGFPPPPVRLSGATSVLVSLQVAPGYSLGGCVYWPIGHGTCRAADGQFWTASGSWRACGWDMPRLSYPTPMLIRISIYGRLGWCMPERCWLHR